MRWDEVENDMTALIMGIRFGIDREVVWVKDDKPKLCNCTWDSNMNRVPSGNCPVHGSN